MLTREDGQVVVHSSTQNPTETQHVVAEAFGLHMHQVVCICKRMGGGFGGKETQGGIPAVMAALVAVKTGRAARVIYNKDDDMCSTGKRARLPRRVGSRVRRHWTHFRLPCAVLFRRRRRRPIFPPP